MTRVCGVVQRAVFIGGANDDFQLVAGLLDLDPMKGKLRPDDSPPPPRPDLVTSSSCRLRWLRMLGLKVFVRMGSYAAVGGGC